MEPLEFRDVRADSLHREGSGAVSTGVAQKINRELAVLLGWGRAVLLQFAHPLVAAGVADHSGFREDLVGYVRRTRRTVGAMLALTFGGEDDARAAAARINAVHDRIHGTLGKPSGAFPAGTRYSARDPELLRWVHATLLDSVPLAYERFVGPLSPAEKDRYCAEATMVGPLIGIPDALLPTSVAELEAYLGEMYSSGVIVVTDTARALAAGLLSPPLGIAGRPLVGLSRLTTIGLLPAAIRNAYGFAWAARDEWALECSTSLLRGVRMILPQALREWPAARAACASFGGQSPRRCRLGLAVGEKEGP